MNFTITTEQMAYLSSAAVERDRLRVQLRDAEAKIRRMRQSLTDYQRHCEKETSGAGASVEPQNNTGC